MAGHITELGKSSNKHTKSPFFLALNMNPRTAKQPNNKVGRTHIQKAEDVK
jgi:hypothetical protein